MSSHARWLRTLLLLVQVLHLALAEKGEEKAGKNDASMNLVKADNKPIESLANLTDGVYSIILSEVRSECGLSTKDQEFLGFNNRTCSPSLSQKSTSGPVMRRRSRSTLWRDWMVQVEDEGENSKKVSLQAFVDPDVDDKAKCLGYVSSFYSSPGYKRTCLIPPYGNGLFLNGTKYSGKTQKENSQLWSIQSVGDAEGEFTVIATNKPNACGRALAVNKCNALPTLVQYPSTGTKGVYTSWRFIKRYDTNTPSPAPTPSNAPPPQPTPSPSPSPRPASPKPSYPAIAPGPVISAPSVTSSGIVTVTVNDVGGNAKCYVRSIVFTYSGSTIGSEPKRKVVDASKSDVKLNLRDTGYNSIYATGRCTNGETTEISNQLSVYNIPNSGGNTVTGLVVEYDILYQQPESFFDEDKKRQVCRNLLTVSPSGTCVVNSLTTAARRRSLLASTSTQVLGTVQYDNKTAGEDLYNDLKDPSSTTLSTLAINMNVTSTGVSVESVSTTPVKETAEPGPPGFVTASNINTTNVTISWLDGKVGDPEETYTVNCVASVSSVCSDSGIDVTGIARGTQTQMMTGLAPNTTYGCWVIAKNRAGSACSQDAAIFRTLIRPGAPTSFSSRSIGSTSVPFSWQDGATGNPNGTYSIVCSTDTSSSNCLSPGGTVVDETGIAQGTESGIVSGLRADTTYKCWVKAVNSVGASCSAGEVITTAPQLQASQVITYDQMVSVTPSTYTPPTGASNLTYQAQCLSSPASVCDPQASGTGALQPSPGSSSPVPVSVTGLTNNVLYQCFSVASYTLNAETKYVCSGPVQAKPFAAPQLSTQGVVAGNQTLTITSSQYTAPSGGSDVKYQVQCLGASATVCDPLATGTGALQPSSAQSFTSAITVSGLTNNDVYQCFSVVTYSLNSQTQYTCSPAFAAIPAPPPTLSTGGVIAGTRRITITPDAYTLPAGTANISYQVQCFQSTTSVCNPSSTVSPSPGLSSPGPIELSGLQDRSLYSCFSVVSYTLNSSERYTCSDVFTAMPYTQPVDLTAKGVISQNQTMTIYVDSYSTLPAQTGVEYQVQCLDSSATVCNPLATGTGALQPSPAASFNGFKQVPGLTTGTTYKCFSVISYILLSVDKKYTCSDPLEVIAAPGPTLTAQKVLASSGQLSITPDAFTQPAGASSIGYQVQCFSSASSVCDLVNGNATPSTPLTSPGAITVGGLANNQIQYCFSVVSYSANGNTRYACSVAFEAVPYAAPATLTSSNVASGDQQLTITPTSYNAPTVGGVSNVKYQTQCLDSSATVCDPLASGTGAVQPATAQSSLSPIVVGGLTNGVTYKCFSVVTYTLNTNTKYTCSTTGYAAIPALTPNFNYPYGLAISGSVMFVTNTNDNSVTSCTINGLNVTSCATAATGFNGPLGIQISGSTAYVVNAGSNVVSACTVSGSSLTSCAAMTTSSPSYAFNIPREITISGTTAYITSGPTGGSQIVTSCTVSGTALTGCASTGSNFNGPRTTAISGSTAFVTNYGSNSNSVTSCSVLTGTTPATLGSCNTNPVNIGRAVGFAIDGSTAFISSQLAQSIVACNINTAATPAALTTCSDALTTGLNTPNTIAIVGSTAYVAGGSNNNVLACTVSGTTFTGCQSYT